MNLRVVAALTMVICMAHPSLHAESLPELIDAVLANNPAMRSQRAQGESAKQAVEGAKWQFYPTPSISFEQASTSGNDPSYSPTADKNITTVRLQQPLWTGVVKYLKVTTIGGVLRGGDELMQIVPSDDDPIIEAKVNPSDIGQLAVGLPVSVKIDAFDYSVYGMLHGELVYISPDTLTEQTQSGQSQSYYRVKVHLPRVQPHNIKARDIVVKPGMTTSIDIRTGSRTVLGYIAKPIFKAFGGALLER